MKNLTEPGSGAQKAKTTDFTWPVWSWSLWDWGSAAFNAVITTFVFSVYITSDGFGPNASEKLGWAMTGAGLLIALFAPIVGQRADRSGRGHTWLIINTMIVVAISASLFFITPQPSMLWAGLILLGAGNIVFEFASVNYNAMLNDISTPSNVGRISGLGWGMGYVGGIVLLLVAYTGFIAPDVGWFGVTADNGLNVRVTMLLCALWTLAFSLPVFITGARTKRARAAQTPAPRAGFFEAYVLLARSIRNLWRLDHHTVYFLFSSAVFRDGLAGVFTFGAVIAAKSFGFDSGSVIMFGVAANIIAGLSTIAFGWLDDRIGPKRVILISLVAMISMGLAVFFTVSYGQKAFWIFGLVLTAFVGPAQSASRTFLSRMIPPGQEGVVFGLYATTGRAVSFMAPAAYTVSLVIGQAITGVSDKDEIAYWGILGIVAVLLAGLLLLLPVRQRKGQKLEL